MISGQNSVRKTSEHLTMANTLTARFLDRRTIDQAFDVVRLGKEAWTAGRPGVPANEP